MTRLYKNYLNSVAIALFLLGFLAAVGWVLNIPILTKFQTNSYPMAFGTSFCFMLSAVVIFLKSNFKNSLSKNLATFISLVILLITVTYLSAKILDTRLFIDFYQFHQKMGSTGRPALNTLISFLLFSLGFLLLRFKNNALISKTVFFIGILLLLIGVMALLGYLLKLRDIYTWDGFTSMALNTAIGVSLLGTSLVFITTGKTFITSEYDYERRVMSTSFNVMLAVGAGIFILTYNILQDRIVEITKKNLLSRVQDQSEIIIKSVTNGIDHAKLLSVNPEIKNVAETLFLSTRSNSIKRNLSYPGFDKVEVLISDQETLNINSQFYVDLNYELESKLLWNDGYTLFTKTPILSNKKLVAYLITEQKMLVIDKLQSNLKSNDSSFDMVLCTNQTEALKCFPSKFNSSPFNIYKSKNSKYLPIEYAATFKETDVTKTLDYRDVEVIVAYTKVNNSGLGLVLKVDQDEIFQPIRTTLIKLLIITFVTLIFGYYLIKRQINPVIRLLIKQKKISEIEKARFIAAAEGGIDNFYIFEAVRDKNKNLIDLRCLYLNKAGSDLINKKPDEMLGKLLLEEVPINREVRLFSKYKYVIETGKTVSEEFQINDDSVNATWIYWQIVKLGDGVAVTSRDITEKKKLEQELINSNKFRSAIIESASYSIIATDIHGTILSINKAGQRMLGYHADEIVGKFTPELIHDKNEIIKKAEKLSIELSRKIEPGFNVFVAKVLENLSSDDEWTYIRKDGSSFPVMLSVSVLRNNEGEVTGFLGIAHDISEQKRTEEYIKHLALHDPLTGLPNRALFNDRVNVAIESSVRTKQGLGVALLDLDYFKKINDEYGHHIGDKVLQMTSSRLSEHIRPTDTVARLGGDEFAFLFTDISHPADAEVILKKIIGAFIDVFVIEDITLNITPSVGLAIYPKDGDDIETLLKNADTAMYKAKHDGRNGYQIFNMIKDQ